MASALEYAPRGLSRNEAARYIGVGTTKFDEMVSDGRMPKPRRIDGRVIWDRISLDMSFNDLPNADKEEDFEARLEASRQKLREMR